MDDPSSLLSLRIEFSSLKEEGRETEKEFPKELDSHDPSILSHTNGNDSSHEDTDEKQSLFSLTRKSSRLVSAFTSDSIGATVDKAFPGSKILFKRRRKMKIIKAAIATMKIEIDTGESITK